MFFKQFRKRLPLKLAYYISFLFLIVIPILIVLVGALLVMNQQFKRQAVANIKQTQETIITELSSDINNMSMRLSHLIYTNNNEILEYASGTDTAEWSVRYEYEQKLSKTANLALEPVKDIVAVGFYMRAGRTTYIKNDIKRTPKEIKEADWYQAALENPNAVCVGAYDTKAMGDLYTGGKRDSLILVFALSPDVQLDRSQKVEMVAFYQSVKAAERIKAYNLKYQAGEEGFGITQITGENGEIVFAVQDEETDFSDGSYTCVQSPIEFSDTNWHIRSYIKTSALTKDFWSIARVILGLAVLIFVLAGYYSSYFLRSIVRPVEDISTGLKQVEEGNLDIHIAATGQFEVRHMINQFNAMVRRLKALIEDYEEQVKEGVKSSKDYLAVMINGDMTPEEVSRRSKDFFVDNYAILGFYLSSYDSSSKLLNRFERNPRFASRCIAYMDSKELFLIYYRIIEQDYISNIRHMVMELQKAINKEFGGYISVCIGQEKLGFTEFEHQIEEIRSKMCLRHLAGANGIIDLNENEGEWHMVIALAGDYKKLAAALYTADEKNMIHEREKMFEGFRHHDMKANRLHAYAAILAVASWFDSNNINFSNVFGQYSSYLEKVERIKDVKVLKLWLTNYFAWIIDYSAAKLDLSQTDIMIKAKRYMTDNYENADMSLRMVAEHIELNEKYFTNRFTKETGETFSAYLAELRMQKARKLLKTTSFKVYEIANMVGYRNVEHFNRMFRKLNGMTPMQYRKTM